MRRCIASGESRPKEALLRFVVGRRASSSPTWQGRLPGRGLWVASDRRSVGAAVAKRLFSRAARQPVAVPEDLERIVEAGLVRRTLELIALARRAGQAVTGFEKVRGWLRDGTATALIEAERRRGGRPRQAPRPRRHPAGLVRADGGRAWGRVWAATSPSTRSSRAAASRICRGGAARRLAQGRLLTTKRQAGQRMPPPRNADG